MSFIDFLKFRLQQELPGNQSHRAMAPMIGDITLRNFEPEEGARRSAVLIILVPRNGSKDYDLILTLRSSGLNSHKGQISFPGGRCENGETYEETALREAEEEIGIDLSCLTVLGELSPLYVPPSNALIVPVVCFTDSIPAFSINEEEVEECFTVSTGELLDRSKFRREPWKFCSVEAEVPYWNVHNKTPLWGATAMITQELLDLYSEYSSGSD